MSNNNETPAAPKMPKAKGPIRFEAVIPFTIIVVVTFVYFHFFFDHHIRSLIEYVGYHAVGAEVDVAHVETNFFKGNIRIQGIEVTDPAMPAQNLIKLGDIRFGIVWDGLLRARMVVEEMSVEQIEIGSARKRPGKVKPPEPPPKPDGKPSELEKKANELKDKALEQTEQQYSGNVLGDVASMLSGTSTAEDKGASIEGNLASKARMKEFEKAVADKQAVWNEKLKSLPGAQEISAIGERLGKVKTSGFSNPQEAVESVKAIEQIMKDADAQIKKVQNTSQELNADVKALDDGLKEIDALIKKDVAELENRFHIPKLDAKSLTMGLLRPYIQPYLEKINYYKALADKYVPPNLMKKNKGTPEEQLKPHPRAAGVTYEFGRKNSYPMFWIKKISVSSKPTSALTAEMSGSITDITSNQTLIGKPTVIQFAGGFPGAEIRDVSSKVSIDDRGNESVIAGTFSIGSMPVGGKEFTNSPDAKIVMKTGVASVKSNFELKGLVNLDLSVNNTIHKVDYEIDSQNPQMLEILKTVFAGIPEITIDMKAEGKLPGFNLSLNSNLGPELEKGFRAQINKKIEELKAKLTAQVNETIGKERAKVEADINKIKSGAEEQIKKVTDQINKQKSAADAKSNQAKKDSENQAKSKAEDAVKNAAEELKKKFGR